MKKEMPLGVKILSILYIVASALSIIFGIAVFFSSALLATILSGFAPNAVNLLSLKGMFIIIAVIMIAVGLIGAFIGMSLWKGKNWARIVVMVLAVLGLVGSVIGLFSPRWLMNIPWAVIDILIIWYLGFKKNVVEDFKSI